MSTFAMLKKQLLQSLQAAGIEANEARREVELIIEFATGCSLTQQLLRADDTVPSEDEAKIAEILNKREQRMPLQYCLGETWFMGLKFLVTPAVLIPRQDTETLVETSLDLLRNKRCPVVADVGTGSGAIAIALLNARKDARVVAIDISDKALSVARDNAVLNGVAERLELVCTDWAQFDNSMRFDAIVSNPPYVPLSQLPELQPEVAVFEPKQAVFGTDTDGLGFYRHLSHNASRHLSRDGFIVVEVGQGQSAEVERLFRDSGWKTVESHLDLSGIVRVVSAFRADIAY